MNLAWIRKTSDFRREESLVGVEPPAAFPRLPYACTWRKSSCWNLNDGCNPLSQRWQNAPSTTPLQLPLAALIVLTPPPNFTLLSSRHHPLWSIPRSPSVNSTARGNLPLTPAHLRREICSSWTTQRSAHPRHIHPLSRSDRSVIPYLLVSENPACISISMNLRGTLVRGS